MNMILSNELLVKVFGGTTGSGDAPGLPPREAKAEQEKIGTSSVDPTPAVSVPKP